jgi:hypothetical protein
LRGERGGGSKKEREERREKVFVRGFFFFFPREREREREKKGRNRSLLLFNFPLRYPLFFFVPPLAPLKLKNHCEKEKEMKKPILL